MRKVIDYKSIDVTEEEWEYYNDIIKEFSTPTYSGKEQFRGVFEVDGDGCISIIRPPLKKEVAWAVIMFLQNLMINQRLRRVERWAKEKENGDSKK